MQEKLMTDILLKTEDIMKKLGISKETLYLWRKKKQFPREIKIGRRLLWKESEIEDFIEKNRKNANEVE
jgi:predicted DNA-binding transcriptional regulator AlpA